jgi:choline dehydrogenase-like flavoprotein
MIREGHGTLGDRDLDADVTIVGAGAVGLVLGLSLARAGSRVLVLEAGGRTPPARYQALNLGTVVGKPHLGLAAGRMKALGGTTRLWGGQLVPFGPLDFAGWPITYDEVEPYFARAFEMLGVGASGRDEAAIWRRFAKSAPDLGDDLQLGMNIWLPTPDFASLFGGEIERSDKLTVVTAAEVAALRFDGARVSHVELGGGGAPRRLPVRQLVLANGTFEIVRLLLQSAAREPDGIAARLPRLGCGFVDHLHGLAGEIVMTDPKAFAAYFDNIYFEGRKYGIKIRASDGFRRKTGIANCAATLNASVTPAMLVRDGLALAKRVFGGNFASLPQFLRSALGTGRALLPMAWRYLAHRRSASLMSRGVSLGLELEQISTAKSRIALDPAYPPESAPVLLHWDFDGREVETAALVCEEIDAQFRRLGIGSVRIDPLILARDPAFLDTCHDSNHHMGGAAMGRSAEDGVVDGWGKLFGCDNLHLAGAATFRSGSFANPTLTALALALRLSDRMIGRC